MNTFLALFLDRDVLSGLDSGFAASHSLVTVRYYHSTCTPPSKHNADTQLQHHSTKSYAV